MYHAGYFICLSHFGSEFIQCSGMSGYNFVSQLDQFVTSLQVLRGAECDNRWNWNFTSQSPLKWELEIVAVCQCTRTAAQTWPDVSKGDDIVLVYNSQYRDFGWIYWTTDVAHAMILNENTSIDKWCYQ